MAGGGGGPTPGSGNGAGRPPPPSPPPRPGPFKPRRGITPESCSSWFLPRLVGISRAQDWMLSGRTFGAEEAFAGGLVRDLLPADDLLPAAQRLAVELTAGTSPVSVALARQLLWRM